MIFLDVVMHRDSVRFQTRIKAGLDISPVIYICQLDNIQPGGSDWSGGSKVPILVQFISHILNVLVYLFAVRWFTKASASLLNCGCRLSESEPWSVTSSIILANTIGLKFGNESIIARKVAAFSSSGGGLQLSAPSVGPFGPSRGPAGLDKFCGKF